ncbi:heme NO-binding domain-containing protein [Poseidonocella sp. HB161398]|uniref:heme NO-binding domain-containing protein n=1 Tax=Poseidonocella sp. HB161398 TaxID=2320855 RepID=UPI0011096E5A|nr:heme NO-binding domain-containing protein [Poseidonocella sp. HB161398]
MHGLINKSIQCFLRDTYGAGLWARVAQRADLDPAGFEAMLLYDDALAGQVLEVAAELLAKPRDCLLEDLGTYLVSHPNLEPVRRLLRFGGARFADFLHSLDELPDRARLAVPELDLPRLELVQIDEATFRLDCERRLPGFEHVLVGLMRTMADDYGALVIMECLPPDEALAHVSIRLIDNGFASGRSFELAAGS